MSMFDPSLHDDWCPTLTQPWPTVAEPGPVPLCCCGGQDRERQLHEDDCEICHGRKVWTSKEGAEIPCDFCPPIREPGAGEDAR